MYSSFIHILSYELILTALMVILLASSGFRYLNEGYQQGQFTAALGSASNHKNAISMYYALYGEMPTSEADLIESGIYDILGEPRQNSRSVVSDIQIEEGAIHIHISGDQGIVSWRPATLKADPLSSIIWVVGDHFNPDTWSAYGPDRTTVPLGPMHSRYFAN